MSVFDERVIAERIAAVVNNRLVNIVQDLEQLRNELAILRGEVDVVKRETIRSISEAVFKVRVDEVIGSIDERLKKIEGRQEKLVEKIVEILDEISEKQKAIAELIGKVSVSEVDMTPILEIGQKLNAVEEKLSKTTNMGEGMEQIKQIQEKLEELEKRMTERDALVEKALMSLQSYGEAVSAITERLSKFADDLEEIYEKVDYLYTKAKGVEEEGEEE